jgi:hypothetical protein
VTSETEFGGIETILQITVLPQIRITENLIKIRAPYYSQTIIPIRFDDLRSFPLIRARYNGPQPITHQILAIKTFNTDTHTVVAAYPTSIYAKRGDWNKFGNMDNEDAMKS